MVFKILQFKDDRQLTLGKFAHPFKEIWGGSEMPLLMTEQTRLCDLKLLYPKLDFSGIELVTYKLIQYE